MFARFRNLFAKSKPSPERTPEPEITSDTYTNIDTPTDTASDLTMKIADDIAVKANGNDDSPIKSAETSNATANGNAQTETENCLADQIELANKSNGDIVKALVMSRKFEGAESASATKNTAKESESAIQKYSENKESPTEKLNGGEAVREKTAIGEGSAKVEHIEKNGEKVNGEEKVSGVKAALIESASQDLESAAYHIHYNIGDLLKSSAAEVAVTGNTSQMEQLKYPELPKEQEIWLNVTDSSKGSMENTSKEETDITNKIPAAQATEIESVNQSLQKDNVTAISQKNAAQIDSTTDLTKNNTSTTTAKDDNRLEPTEAIITRKDREPHEPVAECHLENEVSTEKTTLNEQQFSKNRHNQPLNEFAAAPPHTSHMPSAAPTIPTKINANNENINIVSSIVMDELNTDGNSPVSDGDSLSSAAVADPGGSSTSSNAAPTLVIKPTGDNEIACTAISHKLQEISEVAEALDASIRDVQQDTEALEANSHATATALEKKQENGRSTSSEDWHSRSTEDDSFATASEGNFTPYSHSSSFQTASGRTSSYISSDKNSFDASEADDSTFASAYDMPADISMSYDGSEQSFLSAQQQQTPSPSQQHQQQQARQSTLSHGDEADISSSVADVEELRSQSVTPTPGIGEAEQYQFRSIPIELESDVDSSCIVDSPPMEVLTEELRPNITSVTPEVSTCSTHPSTNASANSHNNNSNKPTNNAAWRRSKYYENITKQTIKGFL